MAWLPDDFRHPQRVEVDADHHLRPIRVSDVDLDLEAVPGSQQRLFTIYGPDWGWPPATMTREQPDAPDNGGVVSWWVVDDLVGTPVERALDDTVPRWLAAEWPLRDVRFGIWAGE